MFPSLRSSCLLALSLLAVATPNHLVAAQATMGCCSDTIDPSSILGLDLIAELLALLDIPILPTDGVIGVNCAEFSVDAVVTGQCTGNTTCTTSNIFNCSLSLGPIPIVDDNVLALGCLPVVP